jgi:hypothetical protein
MPNIDSSYEIVITTIREALAQFSELFVHISKNKGRLTLPKYLTNFYVNVEQPPWATYYESQEKLDTLSLLAILEPEVIKSLADEIRSLPPDEVSAFKADLEIELLEEFRAIDAIEYDFVMPSAREIKEYQETTSEEQKKKDISQAYFLLTAFILQTYQFIALVTHGRTMHDLVRLAMDGDDIAFFEAIQIDRTLLYANSYFRKRLLQFQLNSKQSELDSLSRFMKLKLYGEKYDYPELWITFSILNRAGFLKGMPLDDLLDLCLELKVYSGNNTKAIGKQRSKFLRKQRLLK